MNEDFIKKFRIEELQVIDLENWVLSLRPQQPTLGSMVISLKRECKYLGDLKKQETQELAEVFARTETLLKKCFNYNKINYLALMMIDEQVHFHVIPRYSRKLEFAGIEFSDKNWPGPPSLEAPELKSTQLIDLLNLCKNNI